MDGALANLLIQKPHLARRETCCLFPRLPYFSGYMSRNSTYEAPTESVAKLHCPPASAPTGCSNQPHSLVHAGCPLAGWPFC